MSAQQITADTIVSEALDTSPRTLSVFLRHGMHCAGCVMAPFMTLTEAAAHYRLDPEALVGELNAAAKETQP